MEAIIRIVTVRDNKVTIELPAGYNDVGDFKKIKELTWTNPFEI